MNRKKSGLLISLLIGIFLLSFVSAASNWGDNVVDFVDEVVETINPIARYVIGDTTAVGGLGSGELLFAKVLFLILIIAILYGSLSQVEFFNQSGGMLWTVSIIVGVLAVRVMGNAVVPMILLPYSALGVVISAGIPFIIYFLIVEFGLKGSQHKTVRKIAWIFFALVFAFLYVMRGELAGNIQRVYPLTALISLLMLWFDGTIQHNLAKVEVERSGELNKTELIANLKKKIKEADENLATGIITDVQRNRLVKKYKKKIYTFSK